MTSALRRRHEPDEGGAILLLALAFLTIILVVVTALLAMSTTMATTMYSYRSERILRYNGQNAVEIVIANLTAAPELGTKGANVSTGAERPSGTLQVKVEEYATQQALSVVKVGSVLTATYAVPSDVTSSGERDIDGGQKAREVVITITCKGPASPGYRDKIDCSPTGTTNRVIAKARVRFEVDYGKNARTGADIPPAKRAIVPKVIWWSMTME